MLRIFSLIVLILFLSGCQKNVIEVHDEPVTIYTASDQELMNFYRGIHLVGVRLLSEDSGSGGRANLDNFYKHYFSGNITNALKYLRMSLFADPFNNNSKAVASQIESKDLFGLLNDSLIQDNLNVVKIRSGETMLQVSNRVYGTEHLAVMLDRYNSHINVDYFKDGQVFVPEISNLTVLDNYIQTRLSTPSSRPVTRQPVRQAEEIQTIETSSVIANESQNEVAETVLDENMVSDIPMLEEELKPVTAQVLYQQGDTIAAYKLLRSNAESDQDKRLLSSIREQLIEAPYRKAVEYFHEQKVSDAIEGFTRVLSIEPSHQRAQQYLDRAIQLDMRLRNMD